MGVGLEASFDVVIVGAGAAGLMCAIEAARRGRRVLVIDHAEKPAEKIRISGGGRCNFTHLKTTPNQFISANPSFCISALKRFTPQDFVKRVQAHAIGYVEKTPGQLFCATSAGAIIDMLLDDLHFASAKLRLGTYVVRVERTSGGFCVHTSDGIINAARLVMATGGLSIPKMGATGLAYEIARQFGHDIVPTRPGLVPFTLTPEALAATADLAGVSTQASVRTDKIRFDDGFLFTHRGLSGPACLQASSYWKPGHPITIDLSPERAFDAHLTEHRQSHPRQALGTLIGHLLPKRLSDALLLETGLDPEQQISNLPKASNIILQKAIHNRSLIPAGTEGYRTAEVTIGGVDTRQLSSQSMESRLVSGLYFIGECIDVTGWLGGYNFQWAWSSGWAAGQAV